jgi:hypothetical protein
MSKPKIDLKARLGKRPGATPASASIPPPVGVNAPHPGSVAPAGAQGGYPGQTSGFPASQPQQRSSYDPRMASGLGVGAVVQAPAPVRMAAPVSFEGDEEFAAVRRGSRTKVMVLALGTAVVGGVLGFAVGGLNERNSVAEGAVIGAKTLMTEIDAANAEVVKLAGVLTAAGKSLVDGKYPEAEVKDLGAINIPFDGTNLAGKNIGRFKPQLVTMLINYAAASSRANSQKDKIRGVLSFSKEGVEDMLNQKASPQVRWGVTVQQGPQGPWGTMTALPAAFSVNPEKGKAGGWPSEFQAGDKTLKRYTGGAAGDDQLIPIAPHTQNAVCPADTMVRLRRELGDMQKVLSGDDTPGQESEGIIQLGETIKKQLAAIGG